MGTFTNHEGQAAIPQASLQKNNSAAIGVVATLFFLFGFITCLNDVLIPHLKELFSLNYTESMLVQFTFFAAYFIISLPASKLISIFDYKKSFIIGLLLTGCGCIFFVIAAKVALYSFFLGGLFILASGVTIIQVAANPYLTILGSREKASSRLIFAQGLNSLGTTIAPIIGSALILAVGAKTVEEVSKLSSSEAIAYKASQAGAVEILYFGLAIFIALIVLALTFYKFPSGKTKEQQVSTENEEKFSIFKYPRLMMGAVGIFTYVGAEVAIGSLMINFISRPEIGNMTLEKAGYFLPYYWGGAMVGRFVGSYVTSKINPSKVLLTNAIIAAILVIATLSSAGHFAMYSIVAVGLFNSIMFPTIFVLSTDGMGKHTEKGSGVIGMAIVGGAIIPLIQGFLADHIGLHGSYVVPLICYIYIAFFAIKTLNVFNKNKTGKTALSS